MNSHFYHTKALAMHKEIKYHEALKLYDIVHIIDPGSEKIFTKRQKFTSKKYIEYCESKT